MDEKCLSLEIQADTLSATTLHRETKLATKPAALPKLLYIGDVPIECSYHGSLVLYRLLEDDSCRAF